MSRSVAPALARWSASTCYRRRARRSAATTSAGIGAHAIAGPSIDYFGDTDQNDLSIFLGYLLGVVGFLAGLGFLNYPFARLRGYPPSLREKETGGHGRYFGLCTDHKVVGIQYLVGHRPVLLHRRPERDADPRRAAAARRTRCSRPGKYLTLVGMHGTMMMGMMTSGILGPFAQLLRADHDRRAADGVPADRGAHVLAADGGRRRS